MNLPAILQIMNIIQSLLNWVSMRGLSRNDAIALLQKAETENRDVTTEEVQEHIDQLTAEMDATARLIDENST